MVASQNVGCFLRPVRLMSLFIHPSEASAMRQSDTPVEYRGAQKRLNRTGNLGSVLEDWKRLQGLGLTNK